MNEHDLNHKTKYLKNIRNLKRGFSIIEVLTVIFIISFGLVGVLSLTSQSISISKYNKNELIASQLAQEGLELIRNVRDKNWLISGNNWKTGAGSGTDSDILQGGMYAIYNNNTTNSIKIIDVTGFLDANTIIKVNVNNFYEHVNGTDTNFKRLIIAQDNGDNIEIDSNVQWTGRGGVHNYIASTVLYGWR